MTARFPYYKLAYPEQGVDSGFIYKKVPHITLKSIARNETPQEETLYDKPELDNSKVRVSGPFTVESIPQYTVENPEEYELPEENTNDEIAREGATSYIQRMVDLARRDGITFPDKKERLTFETLVSSSGGTIHAEGTYIEEDGTEKRAAISFGPEHGPVTAFQVEDAIYEAQNNFDVLVLVGFSFDPESQAFTQKSQPRHLKVLWAHAAPDLLVGDLLKTTKSGQLFTVFGEPDIKLHYNEETNEYQVEVRGVDIYNPNTGEVKSRAKDEIVAWFLDTDYDRHTFLICQAFFPDGSKNPWEKLQKALKGTINLDRFQQLTGTISLPFKAGENNRIAVKVIDNKGDETVRILELR
jgi:adenine-specific DNA-methyltransferase